MRVDATAEDLGREAVRTAIARDNDGLREALDVITRAAPALRDQIWPIYGAVGKAALTSIYRGATPDHEQNLDMARRIKRREGEWTLVEVRELWETLEGLSLDEHVPQMAADRLPLTLFVVVGYLLTHCTESMGYATSYDCLDAILDELVTQPD